MSWQPRILEKFVGVRNAPSSGQPTFVAAGVASSTDGATAPTPANPAGLKYEDFKVLAVYSREVTDGTIAVQDGWEEFYNERSSGGILALFYRFHELLDSAPAITLGNHAANDTVVAQIAAWRGVSKRNPFGALGVISTNGSAADIGAIAGITLPANNVLVVVGGKADDWTSVAPLTQSGLTFAEIGEPDDTAGTDAGLVWDYATVDDDSEEAITDKTFTVTGGASAVGKGVMFGLNPGEYAAMPLVDYEWQSQQALKSPKSPVAGASYGHRHLGTGAAVKDYGRESLRCTILDTDPALVDAALDALKAKMWGVGVGQLWALDSDDVRRWCWAELAAMPAAQWRAGMIFMVNVSLEFVRLSDWYGEDPVEGAVTINEATEHFTLTNAGNAPVEQVLWRLRSSSAAGYTNPSVQNQMNGYGWSTTRDAASTSDEVKVDGFRAEVKRSTDDGASYTDDFAEFSVNSGKVGFFRLEPGQNKCYVTSGGTPDASLEYAYWPTWS